jgi:myo-inositol 2-dehydrogenase / D-chiro-inositol 1-dehydrogenase
MFVYTGMGRIGLVHLEAITKAPGVTPVIVSNPTVSKAEVCAFPLAF